MRVQPLSRAGALRFSSARGHEAHESIPIEAYAGPAATLDDLHEAERADDARGDGWTRAAARAAFPSLACWRTVRQPRTAATLERGRDYDAVSGASARRRAPPPSRPRNAVAAPP